MSRQKASPPTGASAEALRVHTLRRNAQRSLSANLAQGIGLSHKLLRFTGAALESRDDLRSMKLAAGRPRDLADLEDLDASG